MFLSGVKANDNRTIQGFVKDYVDEYVGEYSLDAFIRVTVLRASVYKKKKSVTNHFKAWFLLATHAHSPQT